MKRKQFFAVLIILSLHISCKKSSNESSGPPAPVPYMSITTSSTWQYKLDDNIGATSVNYLITATDRDTIVGSRTYKVFSNSSTAGSEYYHISSGNYYNYRNLGASLGNNKLEILYLKDNLNAGAKWEETFNLTIPGLPLPVSVKLDNTIAEKGITRTVNGITYKDVIHVTTYLSSSAIPSSNLTSDIQNYYAPKVGAIETTYKLNLNYLVIRNIDTKTILLSADIK